MSIESALRFVERSTPPDFFFCTRDERARFARQIFVGPVADAHEEYLVTHERSGAPVEERATIAEWARRFVESDDGIVVASASQLIDVERPEIARAFSDFRDREPRDETNDDAILEVDPNAERPSKKIKTNDGATNLVVPETLRKGIANVLAWATRVDEYEHNDKVEGKIHAVWNLTAHLDATERLEILRDLRDDHESTYVKEIDEKTGKKRFKNKKRLAWAVDWIDEMIENVTTGEPFDETLDASRRY